MKVRIRDAAGAAAVVVCASCSSPTGPSSGPPPLTEITLMCPADVTIQNATTSSQLVTYPPPTATGGKPPITISCSPPSNTAFGIGTTTVNCGATDGVRTAVCAFKVTLAPPQAVLSVQNFVAFGDSITAGENGEGSFRFVDVTDSYPKQLLGMMQGRYTTESPQVHNCGKPGESAADGVKSGRIDRVLDFYKADVLLLLEGVNDIGSNDTSVEDAAAVRDALTYDIGAARKRGMIGVFLSTLLPVFPGNCTASTPSCRALEVNAGEIPIMNDAIRGVAAQQNVPLVDDYSAFIGHPEYLDSDGLHPVPLGNQVLAQQFLAAIQSKFELALPTAVRLQRVAPLDVSPDCPSDGLAAGTVLRSRLR